MAMTSMQHRQQQTRRNARARAWLDRNGWMVGYLDYKLHDYRNPYPSGSKLAGEWADGQISAKREHPESIL